MRQPCYKCPDRSLGCHSRCEKYKAYNEKQEQIKRSHDGDRRYMEYKIERYNRMKRKYEQHKKK